MKNPVFKKTLLGIIMSAIGLCILLAIGLPINSITVMTYIFACIAGIVANILD